MPTVTILTGGSTPERLVALAGAGQVVRALRTRHYDVHVVDTVTGLLSPSDEADLLERDVGRSAPDATLLAELQSRELGAELVNLECVRCADVVFPILHGGQAEGGVVQSLLEMAHIEYVGSDPLGSALAMDKDIAKRLFVAGGVSTPKWSMWPDNDEAIQHLGLPLVVKPSRVGSSVGLSIIQSLNDLDQAVQSALRFDSEVLLESYVEGREFTVGVLGHQALAVGEIIPTNATFDYECKYTPGMCQEIFPAVIDPTLTGLLQQQALAAHVALKLRDFSRVDFRIDESGRQFCLEINTLPGLTKTSLLPQSAAAAGIDFAELCHRLSHFGLQRAEARNKVRA